MKKLGALIASLAIGIASFAPMSFAQDKGMVGISMPTKTSTRWISDGETMEKLFKEAGYTPDLQFADDDIPNQLAQIENMVTKGAKVIVGGKANGAIMDATIVDHVTPDMDIYKTEIFGPVLTIYLYEDDQFEETLHLVDTTSPYALTGAIFSQDRYAIELATKKLTNAAGNFYINDKPTGAVVGQQPFGGGRASGTNDKAGSSLNLLRWVSPRTIKENFNPPTDYRYPFMG